METPKPETEEQALARGQHRLLARRNELAIVETPRPGARCAPGQVAPKIALPLERAVAKLQPGRLICARCSAPIEHPGICAACAKTLEAEARVRTLADAIAREIPSRFAWARWTALELARHVEGGHETIARARAALRRPRVVLLGRAGAGKTSLAAAWVREQLEAQRPARFVASRDLPHEVAPEGGPLPIERARFARLLVLDDLGAELDGAPLGSGLLAQRVAASAGLLADRHDRDLPIVITTALDRPAIAQAYGDGIAPRAY